LFQLLAHQLATQAVAVALEKPALTKALVVLVVEVMLKTQIAM
jgi:hypothetical protein